MTILRSDFSVI